MRNDHNGTTDLIQRILEGDEAAFTDLVRKYQKQVHALAWRKVGDFHIAEDITQETFLQVYRKLATLRDPRQFPGWLYAIANNRCITWLRKKRIQTNPLEQVDIEAIERPSYSRYVAAAQAESAAEINRELVNNLLTKLKARDRNVLKLYYLNEMTYAEIGELLGVSVNTVRIQVRRARKRLEKHKPMIQEVLGVTIEGQDRVYTHLHGGFGMKLTFERDDLLSSLQVLQRVASEQDTANVLIRAEGSTIECMATGTDIGMRMKVDGTVEEEGRILVPAEELVDIIKTWPAERPIDLATVTDDHVEIASGDSTRKIVGFPDKAFPQLPSVDAAAFAIDGEILRSVLHKTRFAAPTKEDRRPYLNGLYFNLFEDRTEVAATDCIQIAIAQCEPLQLSDRNDGFIVPLKAVKEIERTFSDSVEIKISRIENQILFADDHATLTTQLVDHEYPDYNHIIPGSFDGRVVVAKESMLRAARKILAVANPKFPAICLEIDTQQIRISPRSADPNAEHEALAVESGTGSIRIGVNARLLIEALSHIGTESVSLEFTSAWKPIAVKPIGEEGHICLLCTVDLDSSLEE